MEIMWNIKEIENISEKVAKYISEESMVVKGHKIYFVDFKGYFGYSVLVFKNHKHIKYANDYELHHKGLNKEELKKLYIEKCKNILFTEAEIKGPLKDYDDYDRKQYYLHNLYGMQKDYITIFNIFCNDEEERMYNKSIQGMTYNPVAYAYMKDKAFVKKHISLYNELVKRKNSLDTNYDFYKGAFLQEMWNHEYAINWEADWSVLSVFGNIKYSDDLFAMFKEIGFNEVQQKAYLDARKEYYEEIGKIELKVESEAV